MRFPTMWNVRPAKGLRSACAYRQSDQSLCLSLEYFMTVKLLTVRHMEFLRLKGGCTGSSESTNVKMPHCWKSHVTAHILNFDTLFNPFHSGIWYTGGEQWFCLFDLILYVPSRISQL